MASTMRAILILTLVWSAFTNASALLPPRPPQCDCFTATSYVSDSACVPYKPSQPCIRPLCLMLSTTTIPGPNPLCPRTPTATSFLPCETACPRGCATYTTTETYSSACIPTTTPPITLTQHTRPCPTRTVSASGVVCPEDALGCPPPDCIFLSTTTVPPGEVVGCPTTPVETRTRECKGRCDYACGTQWSTETATGW